MTPAAEPAPSAAPAPAPAEEPAGGNPLKLVLTLLVYRLLPEQWPECRSERTAPVLFYTLLLTGIAWLGLAASGQQSAFLYFQF